MTRIKQLALSMMIAILVMSLPIYAFSQEFSDDVSPTVEEISINPTFEKEGRLYTSGTPVISAEVSDDITVEQCKICVSLDPRACGILDSDAWSEDVEPTGEGDVKTCSKAIDISSYHGQSPFLDMQASDAANNKGKSPRSTTRLVDARVPDIPAIELPSRNTEDNWDIVVKATDPTSTATGIDAFQIQREVRKSDGSVLEEFGIWKDWSTATDSQVSVKDFVLTKDELRGVHCYKARARDNVGNIGEWSNEKCISIRFKPDISLTSSTNKFAFTQSRTSIEKTATITVKSKDGFNYPVNLVYNFKTATDDPVTSGFIVSFNPTTVTPSANGEVTSEITLKIIDPYLFDTYQTRNFKLFIYGLSDLGNERGTFTTNFPSRSILIDVSIASACVKFLSIDPDKRFIHTVLTESTVTSFTYNIPVVDTSTDRCESSIDYDIDSTTSGVCTEATVKPESVTVDKGGSSSFDVTPASNTFTCDVKTEVKAQNVILDKGLYSVTPEVPGCTIDLGDMETVPAEIKVGKTFQLKCPTQFTKCVFGFADIISGSKCQFKEYKSGQAVYDCPAFEEKGNYLIGCRIIRAPGADCCAAGAPYTGSAVLPGTGLAAVPNYASYRLIEVLEEVAKIITINSVTKVGSTDACDLSSNCEAQIEGQCSNGYLEVYKDNLDNKLCLPQIIDDKATIVWDSCLRSDIPDNLAGIKVRAVCEEGQSADFTLETGVSTPSPVDKCAGQVTKRGKTLDFSCAGSCTDGLKSVKSEFDKIGKPVPAKYTCEDTNKMCCYKVGKATPADVDKCAGQVTKRGKTLDFVCGDSCTGEFSAVKPLFDSIKQPMPNKYKCEDASKMCCYKVS